MNALMFKNQAEQQIHPSLIYKMENILKRVVLQSKFYADFYVNDIESMKTSPYFAWFVYDCGTHFIPLTEREVQAFQKEWLAGLDDLKTERKTAKYRLYVGNVRTGSITGIYGFKTATNLYQKLIEVL
ncbi:hypothetical protein [Paenibacillus apii]|uniref:hypothetical protein n=1 Tax=Paenibacillus apii TaxID=1850370 RepID=UPI001439C58D|nr:hypothetical protein [Paenibacillus apii]NJJ38906.1 hypothetical protein [Paenibacillus apii]